MALKVEQRMYYGEPSWGINSGDYFYPFVTKFEAEEIATSISEEEIESYCGRRTLSECSLVNSEASPRSYSFVSREEDVDYARIIKEAPESEDFILVERKSRSGRPKDWMLLVRDRVLNRPETKNLLLDGEYLSGSWGYKVPGLLYARSRSGLGKFPAKIKQEIEVIRAQLNPKNCRTTVTYL